jgi:hypothetical protein
VYYSTLVDRSIIVMGRLFVVRYMRYKNSYPGQVYVDGADEAIRAKFIAYATMLANFGRLPDGTYGHHLKGDFTKIYELKPGAGRVLGFFYERSIYITNGAPKRKAKEQQKDYEEASRLRDDFYNLVNRKKDQK